MAVIARISDKCLVSVGARTVVGRFPNCDLPLSDSRVSGNHAVFLYDGTHWTLRPHVTTNGTFVDGVELPPGLPHALERVGSVVQFGTSSQRWEIRDLGPPAAVAIDPEGALRMSEDGALALPDATDVQRVVVYEDGRWWIDDEDDRQPVDNGDPIEVGGQAWTVALPANLHGGTTSTSDDTIGPDGLRIGFVVSADGDEIRRCFVGSPREEHDLSVRRHTHLLLELAEAHEEGDGWVEDHVLLRRLSLSRNQLHLLTHRARCQLEDSGVAVPDPVIETRGQRAQRQLRLACNEVCIRTERD